MTTLFSEEDAPLLKNWIIRRLENTSDADADVLADYVLALLRHDGDRETVQELCEAEIPVFLKEDSTIFVRDVFNAIQHKAYLPGAAPIRRQSLPFAPPSGPSALSAPSSGNQGMGAPSGPHNGSRKRSCNDRVDGGVQVQGHMIGDPNGRALKQPRRGGAMVGRGGFDPFYQGGGRGGGFAGGRPPSMNLQGMPPQGFPVMPAMPSPPPGMPPMDPNNPMAAILAMQAMGFPIPGMPGFGGATSPLPPQKRRCRDYDEKGFCARGNTCQYEHGEHSIWVPPQSRGGDEYDPMNSKLMAGIENTSPRASNFNQFRGGDRGRGRGATRGDRQQASNRGGRGRSEFSSDRPNYDRSNTTIVVENIPEERFTEEEVRGFFSEFGNIVDVSMRPYKRLAIVKYDDWSSAKSAYKSPAVIFNNRFVKVYWYTHDDALPQPPPASKSNGSKNESVIAPIPARATSEPQIDIEDFARKQQEVQKVHEEKMKKKQDMEAAKKELEKRQEELMKSQAEEKRKLMERLAAKSAKSGSTNGSANGTPALKSKSTSQTDALKAQLAALEAEAQSLGLDTSLSDGSSWGIRGRGRGWGAYRGRGEYTPRGYRGGYRGRGASTNLSAGRSFNLDNRPKTVSLTGVDFTDSAKDEALREYLMHIGEFTSLETTSMHAQISFKDRKTAENFLASVSRDGGEIPLAGKVELSWVKAPLPSVTPSKKPIQFKTGNDDDMTMDEGDAMATSSPAPGAVAADGGHEQQENLDYDVADDDWGVQ